MNRLILLAVVCFATVFSSFAQNVDKSLVSQKAEDAKKAAEELKKVDTGDKIWTFSGVVGTNAAATGMVNWAAGGKNNVNGIAFARLMVFHGLTRMKTLCRNQMIR